MRSYLDYLALLSAAGQEPLDEQDMVWLAGAMLDGGVPDLELGALLASIRSDGAAAALLGGLLRALDDRVNHIGIAAHGVRPIVIGCYGGAHGLPNLTPLIALLLARFGIPVLLHGPLHAHGGISSALVLRELGILPCAQKPQLLRELAEKRVAFAPDALLAPGLASLLALRARLGPVPTIVTAARLIDPFDDGALLIAGADGERELRLLQRAVVAKSMRAIVLKATDGEAFASPLKRPRIELYVDGGADVLFDEDVTAARRAIALPAASDARATAAWIREASEGARAVPAPLINQLAMCLYGTGYCEDFNQAKALAAVAAAGRRVA